MVMWFVVSIWQGKSPLGVRYAWLESCELQCPRCLSVPKVCRQSSRQTLVIFGRQSTAFYSLAVGNLFTASTVSTCVIYAATSQAPSSVALLTPVGMLRCAVLRPAVRPIRDTLPCGCQTTARMLHMFQRPACGVRRHAT